MTVIQTDLILVNPESSFDFDIPFRGEADAIHPIKTFYLKHRGFRPLHHALCWRRWGAIKPGYPKLPVPPVGQSVSNLEAMLLRLLFKPHPSHSDGVYPS